MSASLPIIRLRAREGRRVRAGSPWAFSNEITMDQAVKALEPGTPVHLAAEDGALIGVGYFNPRSLIAVRLVSRDANASLDAAFLTEKLRRALSLRERFYDKPFYRLVHAEGDGLPGLVIDRFGTACVIQITTAGMERLNDAVLAALDAVIAPESVVLRNDTPSRALEGLASYVEVEKGAVSGIEVEENGVRYAADLAGGQKSGWYYDQRDNRQFMARLGGARVLDAYSYTGGFGVLAAARGAQDVTCLDSSEGALALAKKSAAANGVEARCRFVKSEAFGELERMAAAHETFDIVIADPPPFAPSRKDVESGARAYRKLARLSASVTAPRGFLMLASCSHNVSAERFALECAAGIARTGRAAALIHSAGAGADHPVHPLLPESAYLKALVYALD